jgi:hypothetical protein
MLGAAGRPSDPEAQAGEIPAGFDPRSGDNRATPIVLAFSGELVLILWFP